MYNTNYSSELDMRSDVVFFRKSSKSSFYLLQAILTLTAAGANDCYIKQGYAYIASTCINQINTLHLN